MTDLDIYTPVPEITDDQAGQSGPARPRYTLVVTSETVTTLTR
jgi:hypothetical protein